MLHSTGQRVFLISLIACLGLPGPLNAKDYVMECARVLQKDRKAVQQATRFHQDQIQRFLEVFPSTGFQSLTSFNKALTKVGGLERKISKVLYKERNLQIHVHVTPDKRTEILHQGEIQNVSATDTTQDPDAHQNKSAYLTKRAQIEQSLMNITPEEYKQQPSELKPTYGYLEASKAPFYKHPQRTANGHDIWVLRPEYFGRRLTLTLGNALKGAIDEKPSSWDRMAIPWHFKELLAPLIAQAIRHMQNQSFWPRRRFNLRTPTYFETNNHSFKPDFSLPLNVSVANTAPDAPNPEEDFHPRPVEAQILGPVSIIDDAVEAFYYHPSNPPSQEFKQALEKRGIPVRQQ